MDSGIRAMETRMHIETDYLVVGGGASGMAFADTILSETDADITIVDRDHSPGGHWNHAYPFVRLHQPSAFYGVPSTALGNLTIETTGLNAGLSELATGAEICGYFQQVLHNRFLPSGRVHYYANSNFQDDGTIRSHLTGSVHTVKARRKIVYTSYMSGTVPETNQRAFPVAGGVRICTPTGLASISVPAERFVVLGSGKTAIDVCLWLLEQNVPPENISWISPRDSWFLDRRFFQPAAEHHMFRMNYAVKGNEAILAATSPDDLLARLGAAGNLLQYDPDVRPTAYKCATVTVAELESLRTIRDVVRLGHVTGITQAGVELEHGSLPVSPGAVYVDCTASAVPVRPTVPVFSPGVITLQTVRACQPTFSAAVIAHVEVVKESDSEKNRLTVPLPYPSNANDWISMTFRSVANQLSWMQDDDVRNFIRSCRLDIYSAAQRPSEMTPELLALGERLKETQVPAMKKLGQLHKAME